MALDPADAATILCNAGLVYIKLRDHRCRLGASTAEQFELVKQTRSRINGREVRKDCQRPQRASQKIRPTTGRANCSCCRLTGWSLRRLLSLPLTRQPFLSPRASLSC
eukprot:2286611-Heterocapsa_arctica.AAC.1